MEFYEKLYILRKNKGLTQEELADELFVSRSAISKWESGRGYPSIELLKAIACYFSISIDDLLSSDKLIFIAENENKRNINILCDILFAFFDIFTFMIIILPIYPCTINDFIYTVNLFLYNEIESFNIILYWILYLSLIISGFIKLILLKFNQNNINKLLSYISLFTSVFAIVVLALSKEVYAIIFLFLFFVIKCLLFVKGNM